MGATKWRQLTCGAVHDRINSTGRDRKDSGVDICLPQANPAALELLFGTSNAVCPGASGLTSLSFSFLFYKMGVMMMITITANTLYGLIWRSSNLLSQPPYYVNHPNFIGRETEAQT